MKMQIKSHFMQIIYIFTTTFFTITNFYYDCNRWKQKKKQKKIDFVAVECANSLWVSNLMFILTSLIIFIDKYLLCNCESLFIFIKCVLIVHIAIISSGS